MIGDRCGLPRSVSPYVRMSAFGGSVISSADMIRSILLRRGKNRFALTQNRIQSEILPRVLSALGLLERHHRELK